MKKLYVFAAAAALLPAAAWAQLDPAADPAVIAIGGTTPRTEAARAADVVNVKDYGAQGNAVYYVANASMTAGSAVLTFAEGYFTPAMVGKTIVVPGAGASGAGLVTTISAYTDVQHVTLAAPAQTALASSPAVSVLIGNDDTASINAAIQAAVRYVEQTGSSTAYSAEVNFPQGIYLTTGSINLTGWSSGTPGIRGHHAKIHSAAAGGVAVDALGSRFIRWDGLDIEGDQYAEPTIGLQIGRNSTGSADNHSFANFQISGYFTQSALHDNAAETTQFNKVHFYNSAANAYAVTLDGINHWNAQSSFVTDSDPVENSSSFNENLFLNCIFGTTASSSTPLWITGAGRMRFVTSYVASSGTYGAVLYNFAAMPIVQLDMDVHFETNSITDIFLMTGPATTPNLQGFRWRDNAPFMSNSIFKIDSSSSITSASLAGADIDIGNVIYGTAKAFDAPGSWTVSGRYALPPGNSAFWNLASANFTGEGIVGQSTSFTGNGSGLSGVVATLPSTLDASAIANPGGVGSITVTNAGQYTYPYSGSTVLFPPVTISAPPSGGTQATASVATVKTAGDTGDTGSGWPVVSGGSGYAVGNVETISGGTCSTQPSYIVSTVSGTAIGKVSTYNPGICTVPPTGTVTLTGGSGSGATFNANTILWGINSVSINSSGAGYTSIPSISVSSSNYAPGNSYSNATASLTMSSAMLITAGDGQIQLASSGTLLGVNGSSGSPVLSAGALIDNSGVRTALTTSGYTVPANTSLVRFTQTSTIASATVYLPTALADGQPIQFVNYAGAVTALTFSPSVNGWTNGATLAANTGLRVRWDATASAWYREQ